jgi:hypothetical protein
LDANLLIRIFILLPRSGYVTKYWFQNGLVLNLHSDGGVLVLRHRELQLQSVALPRLAISARCGAPRKMLAKRTFRQATSGHAFASMGIHELELDADN